MSRLLLSVVTLVVLTSAALGQQPAAEKPALSREELEKQLSEKLSGATLVGFFTMGQSDSERPLREDRYTLGKVYKLPTDDLWQFEAKLGYGGRDIMVPMALPVRWAGDTPMIQLTETTIPTMGTYTARVFLYGDQYAGTWKHGPAGGAMFGRIERPAAAASDGKAKDAAAK